MRTDALAREANALDDIVAGLGASDLAAKHGVSETTARRWLANAKPALIEGKEDAIAKARDLLSQGTVRAVERLRQLMASDDEKIALGAVNSWLDRGGVIKTERQEHSGPEGAGLVVSIDMVGAKKIARGDSDG